MSDTKHITAIYETRDSAVKTINQLNEMGYDQDHIAMLVAENSWFGDRDIKIEEGNKAVEGAAVGASVGGAAGAIAGSLTAVGAIAATGGVGLIAAGPIVAALAGAGAAGTAGGIVGGLVGMGFPEVEAKFVDEHLGKGHVMIDVQTTDEKADHLKAFLEKSSAERVTVY
jgi:hypothetical protein